MSSYQDNSLFFFPKWVLPSYMSMPSSHCVIHLNSIFTYWDHLKNHLPRFTNYSAKYKEPRGEKILASDLWTLTPASSSFRSLTMKGKEEFLFWQQLQPLNNFITTNSERQTEQIDEKEFLEWFSPEPASKTAWRWSSLALAPLA